MAVVFFLTRSQPKTYVSEATLNINFQSSKGLSLTDDVLQQYEINEYFENLIQLTRSRKNIELVRLQLLKEFYLKKHNHLKFDENDAAVLDTSQIMPIINRLIKEKEMLNLLDKTHAEINFFLKKNNLSHDYINANLGMARIGKSNYISVVYEADTPFKAAYINGLIIETMKQLYQSISKHRTDYDRDMFEKLVVSSKDELDKKIKRLEQYKIKNNVINLPEHTKAIVNQIVNMEIQLSHLKEVRASRQKAVERIKEDYETELPMPVNLEANQKIVDLKRKLSAANSTLIANKFKPNPSIDIQKQEKEVQEIKDQVSHEIVKLVKDVPYDPKQTKQEMVYRLIGYQLDVEIAEESIPVVQNEISRILEYARSFAPLESTIGGMENEIYVAQQGYLILLNKLNLAKTVAEGKGSAEIYTVDFPSIPIKPKPGKRGVLVVASGVVIFLLIVVVLVLIEILDASISTVDRFEKVSMFGVVAAIPDMQSECVKNGSLSQAEAFHILQQQLKALRQEILKIEPENRIVLWLSGHRMDGKVWFTSQVMESLQKINQKVLLIYGDPHDNSVPDASMPILGTQPFAILGHEKSGILDLTESQLSPLEIMDSANWQQFFQEIRAKYDYIFIVPPALEKSADWKEWAMFAKSAFYLFRAHKIFQSIDARSMQMIADSSLQVAGAVLSKIDIEKMENYIGSVSKRRSKLRLIAKHLINRDFMKIKDELKFNRKKKVKT
ncbi:hypothetical protein [Chloroherpeton thalassium]|nr:hypothetical protein [Chloroherpeton thalassium]